jgi:acetyltransferase-like isoleucine patch superfamily enzyme
MRRLKILFIKIRDLLTLKPLIYAIGRYYGFLNLSYHLHYGQKERLIVGKNVSLSNTIFNTRSGNITIGDNTIFGHNCIVLTGRHRIVDGKLKFGKDKTILQGFDINIGKGCWITSGVILVGPVTIGDNAIICAGSVVTRDIPSGVYAGGVPAKVIKSMD